MKNKFLFKTFFCLFVLLSFLFAGCDNFLNSNDVSDEIKETIKYNNSPVFSVRIAPESPEHGVVVSGNTKEGLRVTDSFDLEFTKNSDYVFLGWTAVKKDDHSISYDKYVKFADPKAFNTKVTIIDGNDDIYNGQLQLLPLCRAIATGIINITSEYGSISYNNETEYKEGTLLKLSINPNPGYGFTHWIIMVGDKQDTTGEFVKIDNPVNTVTDATFVKRPDNDEIIYIIPVCVDRPVVISNTPQLSDNGVCLDSRIKVVFDSAMNESSIYYSTAEIRALGPDVTLIPSSDDSNKFYGYIKNDKKYYKNIEIKDRNTGVNMLEFFGEPKFTSPDMLVIPTSNKVLPVYTELLVTISSNFSTKTEDGYNVSLNDKKIWNYLVNGETDPEAPKWGELKLEAVGGVFKNRSGDVLSSSNWDWNGTWSELTGETSYNYSSTITSTNNSYKYFVRNNKLKINAKFTDTGTGPSALSLYISKVNASSYSNTIKKKLPIRISGNNGLFQDGTDGIVYELTDNSGNPLADGAYRLYLEAEDESAKSVKSDYYYILLDTTNDNTSKPSSANATTNSITFQNIPNASSSNYLFYQMKKSEEEDYGSPVRLTNNSTQSISSLLSGTSYDFRFFLCDEFGNKNHNVEFTKNTLPAAPSNVTAAIDNSNPKKINVNWKKTSDPNYKGADITLERYRPNTGTINTSDHIASVKTTKVEVAENQENYSTAFDNLLPGYRYAVEAASFDAGDSYNSKNSSVFASVSPSSIVLAPDPVSNFKVENIYEKTVKFKWTLPSGFANAYYIYYKDSADSTAEWSSSPIKIYGESLPESTQELADTLTGKKIKFKVESEVVNDAKTQVYAKSSTTPEYELLIPPKNITSLSEESRTNTSVKLKWTNPTTAYDGIKLGYKKSSESSYQYIDLPKTTTSYEFTGLTNSTNYNFDCYTYSNNGNSIVKTLKQATCSTITRPNKVNGFTATPVSGSQIKLSWTNSFGAYSGIKLYKKTTAESSYTELATISGSSQTSYTWNLAAADTGNVYNVKAIAYYSNTSNTSEEVVIKANTSVDPVTNLNVTSTTKNSITVSWTNPATAYDSLAITYTKAGGTSTAGPTVAKTATSATISSLDPGCNYTIKVETKSTKNGNSYTQNTSLSQYTRPNAVTDVTVTRDSSAPTTSLKVSWTKPSGSYKGLYIFYSTATTFSNSTYKTYIEDNTSTTYTITGLTEGTKYNVWVVSYSGARPAGGNTDIKNGTSLNTTLPDSYKSCYTKPNAVTGLKVTATTTGSATLSWTAPSGGYSGYRVYVKDGSGSLTYNTTVTSTSTTISSLTPGHSYNFDIRAYAGDTDSNANESNSATVSQSIRPNAVSNVTASRNASYPGSKLDVSWSKSTTGTTSGAMIFYSTGTTFSSANYATYSTGTSATITNLTAGTNYYVWVVPYAGTVPTASTVTGGTSLNTGASTPASCYTRPNAPTGLMVDTRNNTSIKISWTKPSTGNLTGYNVYKRDITANENTFTKYNSTTSTSLTVSSLKIGHQYEFKVASYAGDTGNENAATTVKAYTTIPACSFTVSRNSSNPNTKQTLDWTYPATQDDLYINIYRGTSSSFTNASHLDYWNSYTHSSTKTQTFENLTPNTQYYYWIVTSTEKLSGKNGSQVNSLSSDVRTISSYVNKYTAPNAPTGLGYNYDDGMGRLKLTWTNPSSYSSIKAKVDSTVFTVSSSNSWIDIPSYSRSSSYTIYLYAYSADNTESLPVSKTYTNNSGNLMINGTTYSYTGFTNVNSTSRSIAKSSDGYYRWETSGKYETHHSVFSNNSSNYSSSSSAGSGSNVSIPVYSMCKYEVNQKLYKAVMGTNPSTEITGDDYPVDSVSWNDAVLFCNKLSTIFGLTPVYDAKLTSSGSYVTNWTVGSNPYSVSYNSSSSNGFRLPTKVQWEFAARGGDPSNTTHWRSYYAGSQSTYNDKTYRQRVAWDDDPGTPHYVNSVRNSSYPHLLGICNMSGNVWEWIYEYDGSSVLAMGGSWDNNTRCGLDSSYSDSRTKQADVVGFRLCRNKVVQ